MLVAKSSAISRVAASPIAKSAPAAAIEMLMRPKDFTLQQTEGSRNNSIAIVRCPSISGTGPDHTTPCKTTRHKTHARRHTHTHRIALHHTTSDHARPHFARPRSASQSMQHNTTQHNANPDKTTQRKLCEQHNHTSCLILFLFGTELVFRPGSHYVVQGSSLSLPLIRSGFPPRVTCVGEDTGV